MARLGVDVKERLFGRTALYFAAITDKNTIIMLLISARVSVDVKTENTGCTPLYIAALRGHEAIVKIMIKARASLTETEQNELTPEAIARMKRYHAIASLLEGGGS